jgi:hypothetical protein
MRVSFRCSLMVLALTFTGGQQLHAQPSNREWSRKCLRDVGVRPSARARGVPQNKSAR